MASRLLRCAGFVVLCWLVDYVVIPAVLWTVLALFGAVPA